MIEYKSVTAEIKDVDIKSGIVCAYWSSTGTLDDTMDIIEPGAFTKSISERGPESAKPRIKALYMHEPFYVLGVPQKLVEDDFGLYAETKIIDTSWGKDILKLYESGVITEHSIGYSAIPSKTKYQDSDTGNKVRHLQEVILYEGSSVIWGANSLTPTVAIKSIQDKTSHNRVCNTPTRIDILQKQIEIAQKALKQGNLSTDEICEALELSLKQWMSTLEALKTEESVRLIEPVIPTTQEATEPLDNELKTLLSIRDMLHISI